MINGYSGQTCLGQAGFFAIGAYTCASLSKNLGIDFWIVLPIAGILAALVGLIVSLPTLKLSAGDNIFIDDSSTCLSMAEFIPYNKPLIITTTSLTAALEFNKCTKSTVFSLGGELHKTAHSCFGPITQNLLKSMYFKIAFLGFYSITSDGLITTNSVNDLEIKKLIIQHSEKTVALIDSSKIHEPRFFQLGTISEVDALVTDSGLSIPVLLAQADTSTDLVS